jgi:hypothetical protein
VNFAFNDNGYIAKVLGLGHRPNYQQIALWLRPSAVMTFSGNIDAQQVSEQLFLDAADWADAFPLNPNLAQARR